MSKRKPIIYIMHPYSSDKEGNYWSSILVYNTIMDMGAAPFNPLFSHQADRVQPRPYREWMELDLQILGMCNAAFRVQGSSRGCDEEMMYCVAHEIAVFFNYDKLKEYIERF